MDSKEIVEALVSNGLRIFQWTDALRNHIPTNYPSEFSVDAMFSTGACIGN
jgi:hypothetical protein